LQIEAPSEAAALHLFLHSQGPNMIRSLIAIAAALLTTSVHAADPLPS
jgi:hypothetical protein